LVAQTGLLILQSEVEKHFWFNQKCPYQLKVTQINNISLPKNAKLRTEGNNLQFN